jgi:NAD(P)-dependent dehydrogenase (short-subunit alcohol dehydrogenase family)
MAIELGQHNIRVNAVCPGRTITNIVWADKVWKVAREKGINMMEASKIVYDDWVPLTPLGRAALPEEIANVILFLCSEEASFITGQCINVNGGRLTAH